MVDTTWLQNVLLTETPVVVLEVLFPGEDCHGATIEMSPRRQQCIPGAISVHPSYFESELDVTRYYPNYSQPEDGNLLPDDRLSMIPNRNPT